MGNEATTFFITDQKMQIRPFKITLVGQKDSGKSDIRRLLDANGIIQDTVSFTYKNNIVDLQINEVEDDVLDLAQDNPGLILNVLSSTEALLLVYDCSQRSTFLSIPELLDAFSETDIPVFLVAINNPESKREVDYKLGYKLSNLFHVDFKELSTKSFQHDPTTQSALHINVRLIFEDLISQISRQREIHFNRSILTPKSGKYDNLKMQLRNIRRDIEEPTPAATNEIRNAKRTEISISEIEKLESENRRMRTLSCTSNFSSSSELSVDLEEIEVAAVDVAPVKIHATLATTPAEGSNDSVERYSSMLDSQQKDPASNHGTPIPSLLHEMNSTDELIERLAHENIHDLEFTKVFLMLYRKFMKPSELLDKLLERFDLFDNYHDPESNEAPKKNIIHPVQLRVCNVLLVWATDYWLDFCSVKMSFSVQFFLEILSSRSEFSSIAKRLTSLVFQEPAHKSELEVIDWGMVDSDEDENPISLKVPKSGKPSKKPTPILTDVVHQKDNVNRKSLFSLASSRSDLSTASGPSSASSSLFRFFSDSTIKSAPASFMDFNEDLVAQQLNYLEFEVFNHIQPRDLLHHIWSRKNKGRHAPTVSASIQHFNSISLWVCSTVLSHKKPKTRAKVLLQFMRLASILRTFNNFNSLMAVLAGINSAPLLRLKVTRKMLLGKNVYKEYLLLETLMSSEKSFSLYRTALKEADMPCVPYIGVFLRDLMYIDEANKDRKPDGSINLPKLLLVGDIILMIRSFQIRPYNVAPDQAVLNMISSENTQRRLTEEELYKKSLELEPRVQLKMPFHSS